MRRRALLAATLLAPLRVGLPADWRVGDKTGAGGYGVVNDVAIAWPPGAAPIVLAVLSARLTPDAKGDNLLIAQAATVIADELRRAG